MSFDLLIFGNSADRSAGSALSNIPIAAGLTDYSANGAPGTGTQAYPKVNSHIAAVMTNSETAAAVEVRFHTTNDPDWNRTFFTKLQTVQPESKYYSVLRYPIKVGEAIEVQGTNAGNVLDTIGLFIDKGKGVAQPFPPGKVPDGAQLVRATATFTHVADTLTEGTITFSNFSLDRTKKYQILGMAAHAATGCFTRLNFYSGPNINDHPGVICADTAGGLGVFMMYGDFGTFDGLTPPTVSTISVAADAATELLFLIKEI